MSAPPLYLLDGSSYVFRAYYAVRGDFTSPSGFPTNAVFGFSNMLKKFLADFDPAYFGVVFDSKTDTFRKEIYPEYKANRGAPPEDLSVQIEKIMELTAVMGIRVVQREGFEADDLMATVAKAEEKRGGEAVLVTADKDFCQIVSDKITLFDAGKGKKTGARGVVEKYGVPPESFVDYLALVGDSSDNIPGVKGVGPVAAAKLLGKYGSLEEIYNNTADLKGKQRERVERDREKAFLSRRLAVLKTDVETETAREAFLRKPPDTEKLNALYAELGFGGAADAPAEKPDFEVITDTGALRAFFKGAGFACLFLRLSGEGGIAGAALSLADGKTCYAPLGGGKGFEAIKELARDPEIKKTGWNIKREILALGRAGAEMRGVCFDVMTAAHFLDSSLSGYSVADLTRAHLGRAAGGGGDEAADKCAECRAILELHEKLSADMDTAGLTENYRERVLPLSGVVADMERKGVFVDTGLLAEISGEFASKIALAQDEIFSAAGGSLNINSTAQLRDLLFGKLGLTPSKITAGGAPSTDSEVLTGLALLHPVPKMILRYRELSKLKSTYVDALPRLVNPATGRVHTSYGLAGTSTGRLSSSDPNLQNIPVKTGEGRRIRRAFRAADGFTLLSADYSQIDLRLLAHFSEDEKLLAAFENGEDIHSSTAAEIFGASDITPEMRRLAKNINFGIIYGISPFGLSKQLGVSVKQSREYMERYFSRYPCVRRYMAESAERAKKTGYAETVSGRRRPIAELRSKNRVKIKNGERAAMNTPIQGSAADVINAAMTAIHRKMAGMKSSMILQVHDELIFEAAADEADTLAGIVKEEMENNPFELKAAMKVEVRRGPNWADMS